MEWIGNFCLFRFSFSRCSVRLYPIAEAGSITFWFVRMCVRSLRACVLGRWCSPTGLPPTSIKVSFLKPKKKKKTLNGRSRWALFSAHELNWTGVCRLKFLDTCFQVGAFTSHELQFTARVQSSSAQIRSCRGGSRGWLGWLVNPLARQPISRYYYACIKLFRCHFVPLLEPNPSILARFARSGSQSHPV